MRFSRNITLHSQPTNIKHPQTIPSHAKRPQTRVKQLSTSSRWNNQVTARAAFSKTKPYDRNPFKRHQTTWNSNITFAEHPRASQTKYRENVRTSGSLFSATKIDALALRWNGSLRECEVGEDPMEGSRNDRWKYRIVASLIMHVVPFRGTRRLPAFDRKWKKSEWGAIVLF